MSTTTWLDLEAAKLAPPSDPHEQMRVYLANSRRLPPPLDLRQHAGKWVALRWDGLAVLAADSDTLALDGALKAQGIDTESVLLEYVPYENEILIDSGAEIEIVPIAGDEEPAP